MQVDRIRSFEIEAADPGRSRASGKATGFAELMDSVLGASSGGEQPARPAAADARGEKTLADRPANAARDTGRGARGTKRDEERADAAASEAAAAPTTTEGERTSADAAAPAAREDGEYVASDEPSEGAPSELVAAAAPQTLEAPMPLAIPVFEGPVRDGEVEAVVDEAILELAPDLGLAEGEGRPVDAGGRFAPALEELSAATNGRAAIVDPQAREALRTAVEQALTDGDAQAAAGEAEGDPALAASAELDSDVAPQAIASTDRGIPRSDAAPRAELASALRAPSADPRGAGSQGDLGGDDSARDREAALSRAPGAAARPNAEASAATAAAIEGATAGLVDAVAHPDDSDAAVRLDGATPASAARAPELPPTLQTARALPTAAPDAIAVQAEWLATRGGGTARLVLNPPELGEIAIRVSVRQQGVEVVMVAQTALAHSMAEDQADRLSQAFASRDLRLDQFEVRRGDPSDSNGTGQFGSSDAGARERERAQDERGVDRRGAFGRGRGRGSESGDAIAPPPRIGTNTGTAGVDLRI